MDRIYRHQRHIYDITRKYYLLGRDEMIEALDVPAGAGVLEVGCGTGRNLILAARRYPSAKFAGLDISAEMLATAEANLKRAGMDGKMTLARADATDFDPAALFGREKFDRIFVSYSLSMIPDWRGALVEALDHLAPGGKLAIVDFGQQENLPGWFRSLLRAWLRQFHVTPREELSRAIATEAMKRGFTWRVRPLYRGYAWIGEVNAPVCPRP
jgi:S-adenosylmethionine-diacylgycerolhomoserine-N-methlytransferase